MRARVVCWTVVMSLLVGVPVAGALDLPPWMPGALIPQETDLPFHGVFGTASFSDINDEKDIVGNRDFGNFGGFLLRRMPGVRYLNCPGAFAWQTRAYAVNRWMDVVGTCAYPDNTVRGYIFTHSNPSRPYTLITIPGARHVEAYGVNDFKHVVGSYLPANSAYERGYSWSGGKITPIDVPFAGAKATIVHAITNSGHMAGTWVDASENFRGFVRRKGTTTMLDMPNARWTVVTDMNEQGQLVGFYRGVDDTIGTFLYDQGTWYTVVDTRPNTMYTQVNGLNNRGVLAGSRGESRPGFIPDEGVVGIVFIPSPELADELPVPSAQALQVAPPVEAGAPMSVALALRSGLDDWKPRKGQSLPR